MEFNKTLSKEIAYLIGVIIGDGNLSNYVKSKKKDPSKDYRITIDISDKEHLNYIYGIIKSLTGTRVKPKQSIQRGNRKPRLNIRVRNKELFLFLSEKIGIPKGNKSSIVFVPELIKNNTREIKSYFIAGYFDSDGGFRGNTLGFTTASKDLNEGISNLLHEFEIEHKKEKWFYKKYGKFYHGIKINKQKIDRFLNTFPLQNKEKLGRILARFQCGDAGVAKRDSIL